jgi:hypothetical protein
MRLLFSSIPYPVFGDATLLLFDLKTDELFLQFDDNRKDGFP